MRTTMNFSIGRETRKGIISTADNINNGVNMTLVRSKKRHSYADKLFAIYDEETGHLRIGQGTRAEMESVGGVRVIDEAGDLPAKGRIDTIYVCLDTGSMYVWNPDADTWLPVSGSGGGGGTIISQKQVVVLNTVSELPSQGKANVLYAIKTGEAYIYDTDNHKYISLINRLSYTKAESDARYAKKDDVYTKTESDAKYAEKGDAYTKVEADAKFEAKGSAYTKTEADDKFEAKGTAYKKSESDAKYATKEELEALEKKGKYTIVKDVFSVPSGNNTVQFTLSGIPVGEISLYINGVLYANTPGEMNYVYNSPTNRVTWLNTQEETGGFSLEDSTVAIEYMTKGI